MNLEKLKETARKFEQKEDWRKAIDVYLKAIQQVEDGVETSIDLSLYNRIGDLYLKINDTPAAIRSYERAVDLYADQGFFNNAIALCGKILRVNPARTQTYLKLAQLHARKNVVIEAKRNLIEFLERMNALGQLEPAFQSVKIFADQFSGSHEIRMMLVELLRAASREDEAREQLEKLASELEAVGDTAGARRTREHLQAIDHPDGAAPPAAPRTVESARRGGDLVFLDTEPTPAEPVRASPAPGLEPTAAPRPDVVEAGAEPLAGLEPTSGELDRVADEPVSSSFESLVIERTEPVAVDFGGARLDGMEGTPLDLPNEPELAADLEPVPEVELDTVDLAPIVEDVESIDLELAADNPLELEGAGGLEFIDTGAAPETAAPEVDGLELVSLEDRVLDDPENPDLHRDLADALFTADQPERAIDELGIALDGYEARERWADAAGIIDRFLAVYPDNIRHHQKRVELAYRAGVRGPLIAAYLGLGDALARIGSIEKAIAVFRRVQEHDPGNVRATTVLEVLEQQTAPARPLAVDRSPTAAPAVSPPAVPGVSSAPRPAAVEATPAEREAAAPAASTSDPADATLADDEGVPDHATMDATMDAAAPATAPAAAAPIPAPSEPLIGEIVSHAAADIVEPAPPPASTTPSDGFIDLGALVLDPQAPADTRMRVDRAEPEGDDEQREFQEILEQFKRGIEANLAPEDYDAHYDLGVAFKEMGLLDEAIAEFQRAARSPAAAARLRAFEALGIAFFEKGQPAVAETVLRRALDGVAPDESTIGLIYWLGRAEEAQGKEMEAIANYERALAVDIRFMDLSDRVSRLGMDRRR